MASEVRSPKKSQASRRKVAPLPKLDLSRLEERDVPASTFSGTVFLDTNANGRFDTTPTFVANSGEGTTPLATEVGYDGRAQPWDPVATRVPVTVSAYDASNALQGTATTAVDGTYTLTVAAGGAYRLEFTGLPAGVSFGPSGQQTGTSIQTYTIADNANLSKVNLGLVRYDDITPDNPLLATNLYVFGAFDGPNADRITVTSFPYASGANIPAADPNTAAPFIQPTDHAVAVTQSQVGATWGLAYDRTTDRLFMSAFTKRNAGYGPAGPGAIYTSAATPAAGTPAVTTASLLVDLGAGAAGVNYRAQPAFTDPTNTGGSGFDPYYRDGLYTQTVNGQTSDVGWDAVGKTGLGGLDVDGTGRFLFTVGLGDRNLYVVDTQNPGAAPQVIPLPVVTGPTGYTGVTPTNPLGDLRPFAVQYYRGSIYVGAVNTAESTTLGGTVVGDRTALRAYVFQYKLNLDAAGNPTGGGQFVDLNGAATASQAVLTIPLNYPRGYIQPGVSDALQTPDPIPADWLPWSPVYRNITNANLPNIGFYPQPELTGLGFDTDGNITLGLRDRSGDQFGALTPADPSQPTRPFAGIPAGDTLRAFANPQAVGNVVTSRWTVESNGQGPTGQTSANGVGNNQGPGGGEFYAGDFLVPGTNPNFDDHQELTAGGVVQLPGYSDVAVTSFDPAQVSKRVNTGGVRWFRNVTDPLNNRAGEAVRGYELYASPDLSLGTPPPPMFAKANGVGDLVAIRGTPMEIGNKIFADLNRDGRQDANEPGLPGVVVNLYKNGLLVATTTTGPDGNYYFSSAADLGVANRVLGKAYAVPVLPNVAYEVRVPLNQDAVRSLTLTTANISGNTEDARDSDAVAVGGDAVIPVTAGRLGTNDHTLDAGFVYRLSLGDFVWNDANNNGMFDAGELPLPNVVVQLTDANGVSIAQTTTTANGGYLFADLNPGQYRVRIPVAPGANPGLAGFVSSTGTNGSVTGPFEPATGVPVARGNNADSGTTVGLFVQGPLVNLLTGQAPIGEPAAPNFDTTLVDTATNANSYRDMDFGFYRPMSIGDTVFVDANNDGTRDNGEAGLVGVAVQLLQVVPGSGGTPTRNLLATTVTNAAGGYLFTNLAAGQYQVRLVRDAALAGYSSSTGSAGRPTGPFEPAIGNPANDTDHGTEAAGFINGPTLSYAAGTATLVDPMSIPAGLPADPAAPDSQFRDQDFGVFRKVSIGDFVWDDANNSGVFDAGETPLAGVTVRLLDGNGQPVLGLNGQPITTTTAADGGYLFLNLVSGTYRVEVVIPAGYISSTGANGSPTGPFEPVAGDPTNNFDHGTTQPGNQVVRGPVLNAQPGAAPLDDTAGPTSSSAADIGTPNDGSYRNQDFGFFRPLAVGDLVFFDADNNGIRGPGEAGIAGVPVVLLDQAGNTVAAATTDANGLYRFGNLAPGIYSVQITPPAGTTSSTGGTGNPYEPAAQNNLNDTDKGTQAGAVIRTMPFNLTATGNPDEGGAANLRQDFGVFTPAVPPPSLAVGDFVWFDANNNGTLDAGEVGAANVTVRLLNEAGATVATQATDANGSYLFTGLNPGVYSVEIVPPAGFTSSTGGPGSPFEPAAQSNVNNADKGTAQPNGSIRTLPFTLLPSGNPDTNGTANLREDFGLYAPPVTPSVPPASLCGTVYLDANVNGVRDAGEKPIPGTTLVLTGTDQDGRPVNLSTRTDSNGNYCFMNLVPGTYTVREQQPDGKLYNGATNVGTVAGSVTGTGGDDIISTVRLNPGDAGVDYNFGEIPTAGTFGYVWYDANKNGVFDAGEPPLAGVPVTISGTAFDNTAFARPLTAADSPVGLTVQTNSLGRYDFPTLPFGTYSLAETQPVDYDDWQLQDGDPHGPRPTLAPNLFGNVSLTASAPIRGPFNFGEVLTQSAQVLPLAPEVSKREFLSSSNPRLSSQSSSTFTPPSTPGVVAPLALLPNMTTYTGTNPNRAAVTAIGAGPGTAPLVRVFDYATGLEKFRFLAYEQGYTGGVRTAVGDVNGDGIPDVIVATGLGGGPRVRVFSGLDCTVLQDFFAYEPTYTGGLSLAAGDVNGDGIDDIITGTDQGGGPRVRVFNGLGGPGGAAGAVLADFMAFEPAQRGGVRVAAADFNGDGRADILASTGAGVPTRVRVFDGATQATLTDYAPYGDTFSGGAYVAAGDYDGDGTPDVIVGADAGGGPRVSVFGGLSATSLGSFFAYEPTFTGGVRVGALDINGTGRTAIVTAAGTGGGSRVSIYSGPGFTKIDDFFAYDATQTSGVYVGAGATNRLTLPSAGTPVAPGGLATPGTLADLPA